MPGPFLFLPRRHAGVLHSVSLFRRLRVVEAVERTHEVARNSSYAFKRDAFANDLFHAHLSSGGSCLPSRSEMYD